MLWSLPLPPILAGAGLLAAGLSARSWLGTVAAVALGLTLFLAVLATLDHWSASLTWSETLRLQAALTPLSATVAILVPAIALPVLVFAAAHEPRPGLARLIALLLVFTGGMELLVVADDLLTLLIGWELVGACSWALIGHEWREADNPQGGLYAFVTTRLGDLGLFLAAMATFAATGGFAYSNLAGLEGMPLSVVAFGILFSAAAKSGQVPFSPWLFRAMAGPTPVSALLHAATMVAAGAYLLARLQPMLGHAAGFAETVIAVGLITALAGGLVALLQNHAKKLLAASTSAHFGLMFVAVGAGYPGVAILHLVAHAGFKALLFLTAGVAGERAGSYDLARLQLGRALPVTAALAAIGALALAGIPPLGGGWTKEAVVAAAAHHDKLLAAAGMAAGGLSAAYALRFQLLANGFAAQPGEGARPAPAVYAALAGLAAFTLLLSPLWLAVVHEAVGQLLAVEIPEPTAAETVASLGAIALGLSTGLFLARHHAALGASGRSAAAAAWLGLPTLIATTIVRPFERGAEAAAWLDGQAIAGAARGLAGLGEWLAGTVAWLDGRGVDAAARGIAALGTATARALARFGEWTVEGLPQGSAALVGMSGRDARRLQTGLSHHYFTVIALGAAVMLAILVLGA